jgi:hypothetical protein
MTLAVDGRDRRDSAAGTGRDTPSVPVPSVPVHPTGTSGTFRDVLEVKSLKFLEVRNIPPLFDGRFHA